MSKGHHHRPHLYKALYITAHGTACPNTKNYSTDLKVAPALAHTHAPHDNILNIPTLRITHSPSVWMHTRLSSVPTFIQRSQRYRTAVLCSAVKQTGVTHTRHKCHLDFFQLKLTMAHNSTAKKNRNKKTSVSVPQKLELLSNCFLSVADRAHPVRRVHRVEIPLEDLRYRALALSTIPQQ